MKSVNIENRPDLIVSVESRKGGVGKTTAALCLARILLRNGYAVLVLDLDVTGTNAADIAGSPFWSSDLHVVQDSSTSDTVASRPANLITMFDELFMSGKAIPGFAIEKGPPNALQVDLTKVNVLGSQIYSMDKPKGDGNGTTSIARPGVLFDDLHTLWLLELVKQFVSSFTRRVTVERSRKVAVVLDNSPGYVGLAPEIHEWLTDLGPICGKFLTITSLDGQDMRACGRAIEVLHDLYTSKWETGRLFEAAMAPGEGVKVHKSQRAFLMRLASAVKEGPEKNDPLAFYRPSPDFQKLGEEFRATPSRYIAALANKVPRAIKAGDLSYVYDIGVDRVPSMLGDLLRGDNTSRKWIGRMVCYDEYLENQFLLQYLQRGERRPKGYLHRLIETLASAEEQLRRACDEDSFNPFGSDGRHLDRLRAGLMHASDIVTRARLAVESAGLGHLSRLIREEWLPGTIVPGFRGALTGLLRETRFPFIEMDRFDPSVESKSEGRREFTEWFKNRLLHDRLPRVRDAHAEEKRVVEQLAGVLSSLVGLSLASPIWDSPLKEELPSLFAVVLAVELTHWSLRREGRPPGPSIQCFLAQEAIEPREFRGELVGKLMHMSSPLFHRFILEREEPEGLGFADFYKACTSAQARLIDAQADAAFIVQLLRFMVNGEIEQGVLFPFVQGIANDVIVAKSVTHRGATGRIAKASRTSEYFAEFDEVLRSILSGWGVPNV